MSEPQPSSAVLRDLGTAATRLVNAIELNDADELRAAMSDHAAALGGQATAMAAAIAMVFWDRAEHEITELARHLAERNRGSLTWRVEIREHIDARFDAYGAELDRLIAAAHARGERLDAIEAALTEQVTELRTIRERTAADDLGPDVRRWYADHLPEIAKLIEDAGDASGRE